MNDLRLFLATLAILGTLFSCQVPGSSGDTDELIEPPDGTPYTGSVAASEAVNTAYVSSLGDAELITVTNTVYKVGEGGTVLSDLTLYAGKYDSSAANRVVRQQWTIAKNATVSIKAADIDHQNLWMVPTSGDDAGTTLYFSSEGFVCVMKPTAGNQLNLKLEAGNYGYWWSLEGTDKTVAWDWTLPTVTSDRELATSHVEHADEVVGPAIRLINSPQWTLDDDGAHVIARSGTYSYWMYGTIRLEYRGTKPQGGVKLTARVRNGDNTRRYFFYTYANADTIKYEGSYVYESAAVVLKQGSIARFNLIEDLADVGMTLADVQAIDLTVDSTALTNSYSIPGNIVVGDPVWESSNAGYLPITNNNATNVDTFLGYTLFFQDSDHLEYLWDFPDLKTYNLTTSSWASNSILPAGQDGRLGFWLSMPTSYTTTFSVAKLSADLEGRALTGFRGTLTPVSFEDEAARNAEALEAYNRAHDLSFASSSFPRVEQGRAR